MDEVILINFIIQIRNSLIIFLKIPPYLYILEFNISNKNYYQITINIFQVYTNENLENKRF